MTTQNYKDDLTIIDESKPETQEYFINMGPQHPSTHGVLRLLLTLDGEIIKKVEPHLGYIHRSIEKMCEKDSYQQKSCSFLINLTSFH